MDLSVSRIVITTTQLASQLTSSFEQPSQPCLAHEEVVSATTQIVYEVESEVMREVRGLISNVRTD